MHGETLYFVGRSFFFSKVLLGGHHMEQNRTVPRSTVSQIFKKWGFPPP